MNTSPLHQLRIDPDLPRLAAVLALVLLAQALLTAQSHSQMAKTDTGVAVVICTWTDTPGDDNEPQPRPSAALSFSLLIAELTGNSHHAGLDLAQVISPSAPSRVLPGLPGNAAWDIAIRGPPA